MKTHIIHPSEVNTENVLSKNKTLTLIKTIIKPSLFIIYIATTALLFMPQKAHAVFLSKSRIDFQNGQNYAEFIILNRSERKKLVSFAWSNLVVNPNGGYITLKEGETHPGYRPAQDFIRYSPRRTILSPGERQKVRLYAKRTADMEEGEYHSHLTILAEPLKDDETIESIKGFGGKIRLNAGISIPIFLRKGQTDVNFTLQEAYAYNKDGKQFLNVSGVNNSTRSIYGELNLTCALADGTTAELTGQTIRLFTEVNQINWNKPIIGEQSINDCTSLNMVIEDPDDPVFSKQPLISSAVEIR